MKTKIKKSLSAVSFYRNKVKSDKSDKEAKKKAVNGDAIKEAIKEANGKANRSYDEAVSSAAAKEGIALVVPRSALRELPKKKRGQPERKGLEDSVYSRGGAGRVSIKSIPIKNKKASSQFKAKILKLKEPKKSILKKSPGKGWPSGTSSEATVDVLPFSLPANAVKEKTLSKRERKERKQTIEEVPPFLSDSRTLGQRCFEWLIGPHKLDTFYADIWEKKPLLVKRKEANYYKELFSSQEFDKILREKPILFSKNVDVTIYSNDERKTLNPDGRAYPAVVWDHYRNGCSVRFLNPQTYSRSVWKLNSLLQEHFGSFVGSNVYMTPPGSQGFAPHYDDIEAFVLQLEGKKLWKVYAPLDENTTLPRYSSKNFRRSDLTSPPLLTVLLEPGDLLYFPRGFIHEAKTTSDVHSLHITLSTCQKNTWGDLLEKLVPRALQAALEEDVQFRESLPRDYMQFMGIANEDSESPSRDQFLGKISQLMVKMVSYASVDSSCDQMAKGFIHDSLPPLLNDAEKKATILEGGERWSEQMKDVKDGNEIEPDTELKLIRYGCVRIVAEEDAVRLYHTLENSREYQEFEPQFIEVGANLAPAVEFLLHQYPNYVSVDDLPLDDMADRMEIANLLYDKALVTIIQPEEDTSSDSS